MKNVTRREFIFRLLPLAGIFFVFGRFFRRFAKKKKPEPVKASWWKNLAG